MRKKYTQIGTLTSAVSLIFSIMACSAGAQTLESEFKKDQELQDANDKAVAQERQAIKDLSALEVLKSSKLFRCIAEGTEGILAFQGVKNVYGIYENPNTKKLEILKGGPLVPFSATKTYFLWRWKGESFTDQFEFDAQTNRYVWMRQENPQTSSSKTYQIICNKIQPEEQAQLISLDEQRKIGRAMNGETIKAPMPQASSKSVPSNIAVITSGFDCKKASSKVEITICQSRKVSLLDDLMTYSYKKKIQSSSLADKQSIKNAQIAWSRNEREKCGANEDCLIDAYTERLVELSPSFETQTEFLQSRGWREIPSTEDPTDRHCNREYANGISKLYLQVYCAGDGFIQIVLDDK